MKEIECKICKLIFSLFKIFILICLLLLVAVVLTLKTPSGLSLLEIFAEILIIIRNQFHNCYQIIRHRNFDEVRKI